MSTISARQLHHDTSAVLDEVAKGKTFRITRNGKNIGSLAPAKASPAVAWGDIRLMSSSGSVFAGWVFEALFEHRPAPVHREQRVVGIECERRIAERAGGKTSAPADAGSAASPAKPVPPKKPVRSTAPARQGAVQSTATPPVVQR